MCDALVARALPGEIADFRPEDRKEAARFVADCALRRPPGIALVRLESLGGTVGHRRMRICIVNDDMPFLVDSVSNALAARDLIIHRLLHPVVCVERDEDSVLRALEPDCRDTERRESIMYIETDRADARGRREIHAELCRVLADVRASVADWEKLQAAMHADADRIEDEESSALLHWFADGAMTLLGYQVERPGQLPSETLGLLRIPGEQLDGGGCEGAMAYFQQGGAVPLIAKAERKSSVHRRVPFDLVVVPVREGGEITGIGVHTGLWTSEALTSPAEEVPVIRRHLAQLKDEFGFDPRGHAGKALRHSISSLPRDLLINLNRESVKELVVTAMSLADRPRPTLLLTRSILKGHLFAFVWLPRDELTTRRRLAIGEMVEAEAQGTISSWAVELGDGDLALIRYTIEVSAETVLPDIESLNQRLHQMVRGWEPSVEEALGAIVGPARATRLALSYIEDFPESYRAHSDAEDAAHDIMRISELATAASRDARLFRKEEDGPNRLRLKTYRLAGLIALSEAVPVLENFGFRVLEEHPTPLDGGSLGYIHEFILEIPGGGDSEEVLKRGKLVERAMGAVLEGKAENDPFNQLLVGAGL
ncbi:MAG TPA: glutamate dehydrogenase, partial [Allosphingosinicella sp.]